MGVGSFSLFQNKAGLLSNLRFATGRLHKNDGNHENDDDIMTAWPLIGVLEGGCSFFNWKRRESWKPRDQILKTTPFQA